MRHLGPRPHLNVPRARQEPAVRADPDDPAWAGAAVLRDLYVASQPGESPPPPSPTTVRLLWDSAFLYVRFECVDQHVNPLHGQVRDARHHEGDVVELFLDPVGDSRQWYEIQVSPAGGVLDALHLLTGEPTLEPDQTLDRAARRQLWRLVEWDMPGLRTAARQVDGGWIAELAVPAAVLLRHTPAAALRPMTLRANLVRYDRPLPDMPIDQAIDVYLYWAPVRFGGPHVSPTAMGYLHLVDIAGPQEP